MENFKDGFGVRNVFHGFFIDGHGVESIVNLVDEELSEKMIGLFEVKHFSLVDNLLNISREGGGVILNFLKQSNVQLIKSIKFVIRCYI